MAIQKVDDISGGVPSGTKEKEKKKTGILEKYFTSEGIDSLPEDNWWRKLNEKVDSSLPKDDGYTLGASLYTPESKQLEIGKAARDRLSTEKLLNGESSKGWSLKEYTLTDDDLNQIGGIYVDKRTGKEADSTYVNEYYNTISNKIKSLNNDMENTTKLYQSQYLSEDEYKNKYDEYINAYNQTIDKAKELENYDFVSGKDYYEYLKANGTDQEIKDFEAYVGSYDDSYMESLANSYKASLVDLMATPYKLGGMIQTYATRNSDNPYDYTKGNSVTSMMEDYKNELESYAFNGKNGEGVRKYSLQTLSTVMPMVNDMIVAYITGDAIGFTGKTLSRFVNLAVDVQFGITSASDKMRERMKEGCSIDTSFYNAVGYGVITAGVEAFEVGNVTNLVNLFSGAGANVIGVGMLSTPKWLQIGGQLVKSGTGEAIEELAEAAGDYAWDNIYNAISDEQVTVGTNPFDASSYGGIGEGGLTDQMIMAFGSAVIMGTPTIVNATKITIDSKKKYNASVEAAKYWDAAKEYYTAQGDIASAKQCEGVLNLIAEEQKKYVKDNKVSAAVYSETDAVPQAPSVQDVLNMTANAFRLDVNDAMEVAEQNKQKAGGIYETLENELVNRGYLKLNNAKSDYSGISIDTYASLTPEGRLKAKEILDAANTIGADVKIDNTYRVGNDIISMEKTLGENENGITINGDTIVVNPYALDMQSIKGTDIIAATVAHEVTHTLEKTKSYADLEQAVIDSIGKEKYAELIDKYTKLYEGKQGYTPEKIKAEVIAKEIEHNFTNLGGMDFFQKIADYNDSAFTKIYSNMKALMSSNPNNEISNAFFKAYNEKLNAAMKSKKLTDVCGSFISRDDCQFNISQYKEKGRDDLIKFLNNSVKNKSLTQVEANDILTQLDYYSDMIDEMANNPDFAFNNFAQWSNVSMAVDHQGYPQLTCVVANGEYKMNIDFSTVCKKRLDTDAVLNQLAKEGILDAEALTEEQIASLRQIVKDNGLEVACALCFVDSKRYKQGGWADTLINGKIADKKDDKLISLGVMDAETKKVMGWNDIISKITPEGVTASNFNFAERPEVNEGTLHTLSNNEIANYEWLKNVAANTSKKSEIGKIANALLNNPELRKTLDLGDLYASTAFKNIKKGNQEFFKIVNQHQGVAKPKSPYLAVTYNNEIIKGRGFTSEKAAAVGGVRIQSFSDYMANMVFDYMEMVAELSAKKLTAQSYTKVPDFAKLFGMTGIKINMSIIPKAITMSSQEFLKMSDSEKAKIKETAGLELFSNEEVKMMENPNYERFTSLPEETRKKYANYKEYAIAERGLSQTRDGSQYSAYIFEDESFDWMEALEIQMQTGYENNVGTICVGVSDEHIWKLLNDDNVKMVIPYHKSSLNKIVAEMMNIGAYNDYTDFQTTGVWDGTSWTSISNDANKKAKHKDFNFYTGNGAKYTGMIKNGYDARKASESYLRYCADMGYRPKFDRFAYVERTNGDWVMNDNGSYSYVGENNGNLAINDNYYKVLIDFRAYDNAGNVAAQKNVKMSFPENMKDLVKESLQQYENATNFRNEKFPSIVEQAKNFLAKEANVQASLSETNNKIQASLKEDYSDAVIKNDKEAAQEVLDKVASEKGYTKKMWNGSPTKFYVFDHNKSGSLFYLAEDRGTASMYGYGRINPDMDETMMDDYSNDVDIKELYVNTGKILDLKTTPKPVIEDVFVEAITYIEDIAPSITDKKEKMKLDESHNIALKMLKGNVEDFWWYSKSDSMFNQLKYLVEALKDQGYDSLYYRDDFHDTLAVFDANQLKSAEPFTYDNNGNLIPLENRFDETTDDIRYSISEETDSDGNKLTNDQRVFFKDSKARDVYGRLLRMYHGTENGAFHIFVSDSGIYFTDNEYMARSYANNPINYTNAMENIDNLGSANEFIKQFNNEYVEYRIREENGYYYPEKNVGDGWEFVWGDLDEDGQTLAGALEEILDDNGYDKRNVLYSTYLNITNPYIVDAKGNTWDYVPVDFSEDPVTTGDIGNYARENGYDGAIIYNVYDFADNEIPKSKEVPSTEMIVFDANQIKSVSNLSPTLNDDINYSISENNNSKTNDEAAEKAKLQQEFADSMSIRTGEKVSVNDINEMWLSATQRQSLKEKKKVAKMREAFKEWHAEIAEDASKWVKGYDTIRARYPMFSKQTIDNFYADEITNGGCSGETYNQLADSLSLVIDYEGGNKTVSEMLNEFYQDTIELMEYEANYQYKADDRKPLKNAIITNMAYDSKDIAGEYDKQLLGASLDEASQEFKQDIKDKYVSMVEQMIDHNRFQVENGKRKADSKISQWRTFDQNLDVFCRGNASLRETMNRMLRTDLLDVAAQTRADIKANAQTEVIDKIKELGIVGGSKESAALQYFLEGHTEVKKDGVYIKFNEDSLNKNYSYKMANGKTAAENIKAAAPIMRQAYDDAYFKITRTQLEANGDIEGKAKAEVEQKKAEVEMLARSVENIIAEIKRDGYKQETVSAYEVQQKKLNTAIKKYNALVSKEGNGDLTRRNLTPYRQNFSHHIFKSSIKNKMNSIINAEYQVPTELAGESDFTKPNTAWTTINLAQEGAPYIPDAVTSFAQYMSEAADVISFNPVITSLRQFASDIGSLATGTLGKFKNYIHDYANMLAGKRNDADRWAQKAMGERGMAAVKVLNGYAKAAALAFNFRSGLSQFANIPNGMAILEQRGGKSYVSDVANGMKDYIKSLKTRSAIDQSPFISNRFFDFDTGEKSLPTTMKNIADGILTTGDKIGAELIWWGAYEQGNRLQVDNSILYADDVTRRAIAGRTKEDMSLGMQSQVINLLAPFQIENINLFQNIRDQAANKQTGALLTVSVGAFVFNMIIKHITGGDDEVLPEFITPIYEEIKKTLNGENDANEVVENIFWGEIAEFLSLIPFGNQVTQLVFGNDSESVFADYNPNRYGTTNIGFAGIGNMIIDMVKHKDDPTQQILDVIDNLVGGYVKGGKQLTRTIEGLQSMGALPKYVPSDSDEESPDLVAIKNTIENNVEISPINYSGSGKIAWVNDQSDIGDWIRATLFGKWSTKGARGYIDSGFKTLSATASRVYETLSDAGVGDKVSTYKDAKTYQTNKSDKSGVSLKEQLTEEGKYDEYKKEVEKKYEEYLKNNTDDDIKTKVEFFNQYGISKSDLQEDTYNDFYKEYKVSKTDQVISQAMKIEDVVQNGETVKNGAAALRRQTYEAAGIYDSLVQYIKDNNLLYTDFGLNKTVVEASDSELNKIINKTQGIEEDTTSSSSSTTRQKAIKKIASDYKSKSSAALDLLDNMTSVADAKKKAQATRK